MASDKNINPLPLHTPSGMGGIVDLDIILSDEINSFRAWVGSYKKELIEALDSVGRSYVNISGFECYDNLYRMDAQVCDEDSPVGEFLEVIGFQDQDYIDLCAIWNEDSVAHIHHIWRPQWKFQESDFDFYINYIRDEMLDVSRIVYRNGHLTYGVTTYPTEPDRPALSILSNSYDLQKDDSYSESFVPDRLYNEVSVDLFTAIDPQLYVESEVFFFDAGGLPIVKSQEIHDSILSLITVGMQTSITSVSVTKVSEYEAIALPFARFTVIADEEIVIDYNSLVYDRWYFGDSVADYSDGSPSGASEYSNWYINLLWRSRSNELTPDNPQAGIDTMFVSDGGRDYFLRTDFESFSTPDEIAYYISLFTYFEIEEEELKFWEKIVGVISFVLGAWLFFMSAGSAGRFLFAMATRVLGASARNIADERAVEMQEQMQEQIDADNEAVRLQSQSENKADLSFTNDFYDKIEPINVFAIGALNPLKKSYVSENPFTVGGEFFDPHTKLINQRDIL